jgi:hypothetical protein
MGAHGRGGSLWARYSRRSAASLSIHYSGVVSDMGVSYSSCDNSKTILEVNKKCQKYLTQ